mgnify:CR=1 FL=1
MKKELLSNPKITAEHLSRKAVIYLRQSSERQVRENRESRRLQYGLVERAKRLGFRQVEVIDIDLGLSASAGAGLRKGFEHLISAVALGEVGLVLSREVSRLSRSDKDFCRLLEVCRLFSTLIGDAEQIYDLDLMDDQLILGIKGTLSVVELKVLKLRMIEGMKAKARRGKLLRLLPPGYVRHGSSEVVKDPDRRIQQAIELLFAKFHQIESIRQTFLWFHHQGIELPVNKAGASGMRVVWQLPTRSFISSVLHNPFYAGAYVWGQRPIETVLKDGKLTKRAGQLRRPEQCEVFIRDHHEGYISWAQYEENQRKMRANSLKLALEESVAVVRGGQGLLVGLLRCGRCGRKLHVRYWGRQGTAARYLCKGDFDTGGKYCLGFGGSLVDRRFSRELERVISPWGIEASLEAIRQSETREEESRQALSRRLEQLEYETQRAFEQYDEVDARNRLVAAELERRWNQKLEEVESLKSELDRLQEESRRLTNQEREEMLWLGQNFSSVWNSEDCTVEIKKKIIRAVVEEIIVGEQEEGEELHFTIHWKGGSHTEYQMPRPVSGVGQKTSLEDLEVIRRMAVRYGDGEIARVLNQQGKRTARGEALEYAAGRGDSPPPLDCRPKAQSGVSRHFHPGSGRHSLWSQSNDHQATSGRGDTRQRAIVVLGTLGNPTPGPRIGSCAQYCQTPATNRETGA